MITKELKSQGDKIILTTTIDGLVGNYHDNMEQRNANYNHSKKLKFWPVSSIPRVELDALIATGDLDAIAYDTSNDDAIKRPALRRLLERFPRWRIGDARI